jgi:hypothetical protein
VELSFDYMEKNDGVIIQVTQTGKNSDCIDFLGRIKGAKLIRRKADKKIQILWGVFPLLATVALGLIVNLPFPYSIILGILAFISLFPIINWIINSLNKVSGIPNGLDDSFHSQEEALLE